MGPQKNKTSQASTNTSLFILKQKPYQRKKPVEPNITGYCVFEALRFQRSASIFTELF